MDDFFNTNSKNDFEASDPKKENTQGEEIPTSTPQEVPANEGTPAPDTDRPAQSPVYTPNNQSSANNSPYYSAYRPEYYNNVNTQYQPPRSGNNYASTNYQNPYYSQGQYPYGAYGNIPSKKKKNKGLIALLCTIGGLIVVFSVAFVAYQASGILKDNFKAIDKIINNSSSTVTSENDVTNPNAPGLDIENQPTVSTVEYSAQAAYDKLSPSVVGIQCFSSGAAITDTPDGEGTGIVVSSDGYIATNSHVIGDSKNKYKIMVIVNSGEEYEAAVVGFDTKTDLAVLKINASEKLYPATFANSDDVNIGQDVIAIGNPGGLDFSNSLTKGIVSATNRSVGDYSYVGYIQTDAAINPGNSGGPLSNLYGQVIGINTIKIADSEYEGMGFAIPSNTVKKICDDLISQGYVSNRVRIGITGQEISTYAAESYGVPSGILIVSFASDSPFNKTDAKEEDIITSFNGTEISSFSQLYKELDKYKPGDKVTVTLYRSAGVGQKEKTFDVTITLVADKGETQAAN